MAVISVIRGWECEGCGINRNEANEVWRDCVCKVPELKEHVEVSNKIYWEKFWKGGR